MPQTIALTRLVLAQRLLRRRDPESDTGYHGRQVIADLLIADTATRAA